MASAKTQIICLFVAMLSLLAVGAIVPDRDTKSFFDPLKPGMRVDVLHTDAGACINVSIVDNDVDVRIVDPTAYDFKVKDIGDDFVVLTTDDEHREFRIPKYTIQQINVQRGTP